MGILILLIILLMPYNLIGEGTGNLIIFFIGISILLRLIKFNLSSKFNSQDKAYLFLLVILSLLGIVNSFRAPNFYEGLRGSFLYLCLPIYYTLIVYGKNQIKLVLQKSIYIITVVSGVSIIYQGVIKGARIDGTIGYANTFAIIILVFIYLIDLIEIEKYRSFIKIIFYLAIIYTGSRSTFLYLVLYLIYMSIKNAKYDGNFSFLSDFLLSLVGYFVINAFGIIAILILPLTIPLFNMLRERDSKTKIYILVGIGVFGSIFYGKELFNSSLLRRLSSISFYSGELQERLLIIEDSWKYLVAHPIGLGSNSFQYLQYYFQTAFYDVKYIHSSPMQIGFELGIFGMIIYLMMFLIGLRMIKNHENNRNHILMAYITLYLHGLLDFDFSYVIVYIITFILIVIDKAEYRRIEQQINKDKNCILGRIAVGICIVISIYFIAYDSLVLISNIYLKKYKHENAINILNFAEKISPKDSNIYMLIGQAYHIKAMEEKEISFYEDSINGLEKALHLNPKDIRAHYNMALAHSYLNNYREASASFDKILEIQKFNPMIYTSYLNVLEKAYIETSDIEYKYKLDSLNNNMVEASKKLNPKAKYLKNQLYQ